uniref:SigB/SigF/SigG family RNA polymerase sigma factor n=1 Tax=Ndongobacter massiliensis TaxID=1871025 RepID=UPI0009307D28|nr:SigB/SigF/SigG family RNA polymerase sigma factor [Ndongobacter massiliensis]
MSRAEKKQRRERTRVLFQQLKETGDKRIRDQLITEYLYIAEILAKKYVNRGIEYDDLYQVASLALIYAVDRYDVSKGYEFSSFATPTIVGELKRHFRDKGWVIRVPRRIQELSKKANQARVVLTQQLQRQPTIGDIAEYLGISEEEVLESMEASKVYAPQSLDQSFESGTEERDMNLGDLVGAMDENFDQIDFEDLIARASADFNELEKKILYFRYYDKKTQTAIARELSISQMTVSRIEKKIIQKFRDELHITEADLAKKK